MLLFPIWPWKWNVSRQSGRIHCLQDRVLIIPHCPPKGTYYHGRYCSKLQDKVNRPFHIVVVVVQPLSHIWLFATPWTAACQASLSFAVSWSLLKLMSVESVMPSSHLILCGPLLLLTHLSIYSFLRTLRDYVSDRTRRALGAHDLCLWTDQPESVLASHLLCNQSVAQSFSFLCCRIKIILLSTWVVLGQHQKRWPASRQSTVPSRWLTPSSSPPSFSFALALGNQGGLCCWPYSLQPELLALCSSPLQKLHLELRASQCLSHISLGDTLSPLYLLVDNQSPSVLLLPIHLLAFLLFSHHPISTSALSWHPLCADRTQQLLHLSGSLIFGETLVICLVPRPLQWVGPHLSKNFALWLPLECFFFFLNPWPCLHFIVVQLHLGFLFFSVSVGQLCLVSATQAAVVEKTDGSMLSKSFSNLPSAGHRMEF